MSRYTLSFQSPSVNKEGDSSSGLLIICRALERWGVFYYQTPQSILHTLPGLSAEMLLKQEHVPSRSKYPWKAQQESKRKNLHLVTAVDIELMNQLLWRHLSRYPEAIPHLVMVVPKPDRLTLRA